MASRSACFSRSSNSAAASTLPAASMFSPYEYPANSALTRLLPPLLLPPPPPLPPPPLPLPLPPPPSAALG